MSIDQLAGLAVTSVPINMGGASGVVLIAEIVLAVIAVIAANTGEKPARQPGSSEASQPGLDLGEGDVLRDESSPSVLLPLGWGMVAIGVVVAFWAWFFMDITPVAFSDTVNIDAVSQRSIVHTTGLVLALAGAVLACAGHIVNEVRRGR